ncbi:MAG: DUF3990 domain-containing protein [Oscillospiraceae bacterium]|nr:DUF3990 domain-containing protein [Oscillospiraceae bacterium]
MILYHGSNTKIPNIDLSKARPYKDFGRGFYLTEIKEQAERMADRVADRFGGTACISTFELNDDFVGDDNLNVLKFDNHSKEWALFVMNNRDRNFKDFEDKLYNGDNKYDIVVGAVANDDLVETFDLFRSGYINIDELVKQIIYRNLTNQYSFHSEKAIRYLKAVE